MPDLPAAPGFPTALIGRAHRALESIHSMVYFVPEGDEEYVAVGLRPGRMGYFASRAAPMGAVGPEVVTATFYNFNPALVARHIPRAWTLASPDAIVQARFRVADRALRRLWGDEIVRGPEVAEAADLVRLAAGGCTPEGRPLYAGLAGLDWPEPAHLALWHGTSVLREHRGDGHLAALLRAGLSGIEAIVTHTATGRGFLPGAAQQLRFWSDEDWAAAVAGLADRGLVTADGALTATGVALRSQIEADTDAMDAGPWRRLGVEGTERLIELGKPLSRRLAAGGAFPPGVFAPGR